MPYDYMSEHYTPFEQNLALNWASSLFGAWFASHPNATYDERRIEYFACIEGGLGVALEFRHQNS